MEADVIEMETVLVARGIRISAFCESAGIARTTWDRWKNGKTLPNMRTWMAVRDAYRAALKTKGAAA